MKRHSHIPNYGLTLTELLVVISIIVILAGVMVPMMQPFVQGQDVREAARMLNAYIAGAQSIAVRSGRPAGILLEKDPNNSATCYRCFIAEVPRPYSGDTEQARATVVQFPDPSNHLQIPLMFQNGTDVLRWYNAIISREDAATIENLMPYLRQDDVTNAVNFPYYGDEIRFNQKGPRYPLFLIDYADATHYRLWFLARPNEAPPLTRPNVTPVIPLPLTFEIYRRPEKTSRTPLNLPAGTAIDFSIFGSGWGENGYFAVNNQPIIVTFRPQIGMDRVYANGQVFSLGSMNSLMFLVGHGSQVPVGPVPPAVTPQAANPQDLMNFQDSQSMWVTVNVRTGRVNTAQNLGVASPIMPQTLSAARQLALTEVSVGGR